jgi:hypothetical protein
MTLQKFGILCGEFSDSQDIKREIYGLYVEVTNFAEHWA